MNNPSSLNESAPNYWRWLLVLICCFWVFIGLSWSQRLSPSVRSAETKSETPAWSPSPPVFPIPSVSNDASSPLPAVSVAEPELKLPLDNPVIDTSIDTPPLSGPATSKPTAPLPAADLNNPRHIAVLNYHSITVDPGNPAVITPDKFKAQMVHLSNHGYTTLSLQQFLDYMDNKSSAAMPSKPVLLTFDDGYADNYVHVMPILQELDFHATIFISPGTTEDGYFLNWDQIKEMQQAGWDIQPHGMTHPHLPKLTAVQQAYEITEAKRQIEVQLGIQSQVFCYPYGERNAYTIKVLEEQGFRYAFTIEQGVTTRAQNRFALKRLFVNGEDPIERWISRLEAAFPN
jgi:peptidoglycan/xylan/chitin deacetylase (PgdA/CDA1 family)